MKTHIEIITGFLSTGKTSFINVLTQITLIPKERLLILQCESGSKNIEKCIEGYENVVIKTYKIGEKLTEGYIKNILDTYKPHRLIIEHNGTIPVTETLSTIYSKKLKKVCKVTTIFYISEASTFNFYINNMVFMILPSVQYANLILINNIDDISKNEREEITKKINFINPYAYIVEVKKDETIKNVVNKANLLDKGLIKSIRIYFKDLIYNKFKG